MISLIAAIGNNRELGYKNRLPWKRMGADMNFFHSFVTNKVVIMGAQSYFSLPIALDWKTMIVISQTKTKPKYPRTHIVSSPKQALELAQKQGEKIQCQDNEPECKQIVIAGGASTYEQFLPQADKMYLTLVHENFPNADRFFPEWNNAEWKQTKRTNHKADQNNPHAYSFVELERVG